jgi:hypothetical protein
MLWLPGRTIRDTRELQLPPDVLPGLYDLKVGVYRYPTIEHLPVQVNGNPQAEDLVTIATVRVKPVPPSVPPLVNPNLAVGDSIRLVGMDAETYRADTPRARARASDRLLVEATRFHLLDLNLYWQRTSPAPIAHDYTVFLHVVDRTGNLVAQIDRQPVLSKYPTSLWEQNEVVTDPYNLDLGALPAGPYTVYAGMYDNATGARLALHNANGQRLDDDRALLGELVVSE